MLKPSLRSFACCVAAALVASLHRASPLLTVRCLPACPTRLPAAVPRASQVGLTREQGEHALERIRNYAAPEVQAS